MDITFIILMYFSRVGLTCAKGASVLVKLCVTCTSFVYSNLAPVFLSTSVNKVVSSKSFYSFSYLFILKNNA